MIILFHYLIYAITLNICKLNLFICIIYVYIPGHKAMTFMDNNIYTTVLY